MNEHIANALKMWMVLTCAANNSRIMTYKELGDAVGIYHRGPVISKPLGFLKRYCKGKKLPALTALVVNENTGMPESKSDVPTDRWPRELRKIFRREWVHVEIPTPESLERWGRKK